MVNLHKKQERDCKFSPYHVSYKKWMKQKGVPSMKMARFVCKIVGFSLALASIACLMVGYWDCIATCFRRMDRCMGGKCREAELDDFVDVI